MKKIVFMFALAAAAVIGTSNVSYAQTPVDSPATNTTTQPTTNPTPEPAKPATPAVAVESVSFHQSMKKSFIDGGWEYMAPILVCLIFGLAIAIERVITLSLASINTKKLLAQLEKSIASGDFEGARAICKSTPGPTAEVIGEGLRRVNEGVDGVEKAIVANASVQTSLLEKGLVWISLCIAIAPMLGFFGTVIGMIIAFDTIEKEGDIKPASVAGGIKVALLTTVLGLVVAMILQVFYNYITSKVDGIVTDMEDATISVLNILIENGYAEGRK